MKPFIATLLCALALSSVSLYAAGQVLPDELTLDVGAVEKVGTNVTLLLTKRSVRTESYALFAWADDGFRKLEPFPVCTYRGYVKGDPAMRVNANLEPGGVLNANFSQGADLIATIRDLKVAVPAGTGKSTPLSSSGNKVVPWSTWKPRAQPPGGYRIPPYPMRRITINVIINRTYVEQTGNNLEQAVAEVEQRFNDSDFVYARDLGAAWEINTVVCETGSGTNVVNWGQLEASDPARKSTLHANIHCGPGGNGSHAGPAFTTGGGEVYAAGRDRAGGGVLHEIGHKFAAWHKVDNVDIMDGCRSRIAPNNLQHMLAHCEHATEENFPGVIYSGALPPRALEDFANTRKDTPVAIDVLENDYDGNGDSISLQSAGPKSEKGGVVVLSEDKQKVVYTPPPGFVGSDAFTYATVDSAGAGNRTGRVRVDVRTDGLASYFSFDAGEVQERPGGKGGGLVRSLIFADQGPWGSRATAIEVDGLAGQGVRGNSIICRGNPNAVVDIPEGGDPGRGSLSVSVWVLYTKAIETSGVVIEKGGIPSAIAIGDSQSGWGIAHLENGKGFKFMGNLVRGRKEDAFDLTSHEPILPNAWYHLVMVMDRDTKKLRAWVNSKEVLTSGTKADIPDGVIEYWTPLRLYNAFVWKKGGWKAFPAVMDELKIFTAALTPKQVEDLYAEGRGAKVPEVKDDLVQKPAPDLSVKPGGREKTGGKDGEDEDTQ